MRTERVSRLRKQQAGEDRYGDPIFEEVESALPRALFAPGGVSEPVEPGRAPVVTEPTLYWRRQRPDVRASDRIKVRGRVFEVEGEPSDWRGRSVGGLVVKLRRAEEGVS